MHVVTQPTLPFLIADGRLEVHQIPAEIDNLTWLVVCTSTATAFAVDGPRARPVLEYCQQRGFKLAGILNTHVHWDHVGLNRELAQVGQLDGLRVVGAKKTQAQVPGLTEAVGEGDVVKVGETSAEVWLTEGHLDGHLSFVFDGAVFCGDTLFAGGCGFLVGGRADAMHASLQRLINLPSETWVCCAHEYTQDNLRFAWSVEPDNEALAERIRQTRAIRANGGCTVPSTVGLERATNPFVRTQSATIRRRLAAAMPTADLSTDVGVFAALRTLKNQKHYRSTSGSSLSS